MRGALEHRVLYMVLVKPGRSNPHERRRRQVPDRGHPSALDEAPTPLFHARARMLARPPASSRCGLAFADGERTSAHLPTRL